MERWLIAIFSVLVLILFELWEINKNTKNKNGECADIEKAFSEKDWSKLDRYLCKYAESEDERVRMELIEYLRGDLDDITTDDTDRWISWLEKQKDAFENGRQLGIMQEQARQELEWTDEKQKEQKPNYCHHEVDETGWTEEYRKAYYDGWNNCNMQHEQLKADHMPAEWSEEDEKMRNLAIEWAETISGQFRFVNMDSTDFCKITTWLKSLRPQSHWKPSEVVLEKASRNVYQSWMGGTMNDVRRDMVELGKVLNARKCE